MSGGSPPPYFSSSRCVSTHRTAWRIISALVAKSIFSLMVTMDRNRLRAQVELPRDFLGGLAFAEEPEELELSVIVMKV